MVQCRKTLWNPKSLDSALDYFFWCIICWLFNCFYKCRAQALLRLMGSKAKWSQATNSEGFSSTIQSDLFGSCKSNVNSILLISYYYFVPSSKLLPFIFAKVYILVRLYTFYCRFFFTFCIVYILWNQLFNSRQNYSSHLIFAFLWDRFTRKLISALWRFVSSYKQFLHNNSEMSPLNLRFLYKTKNL